MGAKAIVMVNGHGLALSTEPGDSFPARLFRLCKRSTLISGLWVQLGQHLKTDTDLEISLFSPNYVSTIYITINLHKNSFFF
jgi:hypothetical protein